MKSLIIEKLKEKIVAKKVLEAKSSDEVYEIFKSYNVEVSKEEASEVLKDKESLISEISKLSEEELINCAGGLHDGIVSNLSRKIWFPSGCIRDKYGDRSNAYSFCQKVGKHSDKIVEGTLAVGIVGATVATTLGIQKIVNYYKNKQNS